MEEKKEIPNKLFSIQDGTPKKVLRKRKGAKEEETPFFEIKEDSILESPPIGVAEKEAKKSIKPVNKRIEIQFDMDEEEIPLPVIEVSEIKPESKVLEAIKKEKSNNKKPAPAKKQEKELPKVEEMIPEPVINIVISNEEKAKPKTENEVVISKAEKESEKPNNNPNKKPHPKPIKNNKQVQEPEIAKKEEKSDEEAIKAEIKQIKERNIQNQSNNNKTELPTNKSSKQS